MDTPILPFAPNGAGPAHPQLCAAPTVVSFHRRELGLILSIYGRMVAAGEWRDYAIGHGKEAAVFCIYRRTSENPLFRVEKRPKLAQRQGAYAILSAEGQVLKRGRELPQVLQLFERKWLKLVD
ncbi:MAG: DUF2794 domain-containing protein [Neomegalonema sp.]|nr:DUF2794 domain-containing protein [Neomegalonema sp.]